MTQDYVPELIEKAIQACDDLLVFLDPDKVPLLHSYFSFLADQYWASAAQAPNWDGVVGARGAAQFLSGPGQDLRGMVEARRTELQHIRDGVEAEIVDLDNE